MDNLQGCIQLTIEPFCFSFLSLFFMEIMYSQNYENGILEVLEIKTFFAAQPWWTDFLRIFVKLCGFYTSGTSEKFSKKVKMF